MFGYVEKFFPEVVERIRRLPAAIKVALVLLLAVSPLVASHAVAASATVASLLGQRYSLSGSVILFSAVAFLVTVPVALLLINILRSRSTLVTFCRQWTHFDGHFSLLYLRIEVYLLRDKNSGSGFDSPEWQEIEPMLPEYSRLRGRLRKLLFLLDEGRLIIRRVPAWEQLCRKNPVLTENGYRTPFSFLLSLGNPIAAVNLDGQQCGRRCTLLRSISNFCRTRTVHFTKPLLKFASRSLLTSGKGNQTIPELASNTGMEPTARKTRRGSCPGR